ncbi:hypothetical protein CV102_11675 [Natronococcus pandeyae]|uniref:Uncharacterized protein n=1 Tax=Natronococcus pandeyae TaxID=2055836 RepID=A0A8J8Q125_9EURY|nr:hypothetical protein [Natronococcus pandeyae]TYL38456.1 hypothetical protein CV102_11675 [Natronococcus pandeyae]
MRETIIAALRQPEYTGENRCAPCTILNLGIAGAIGVAVARRSRLAGALVVGLSAAAIYLRGYLVPGTPELTKRYLPPSVLRLFGKEPEPTIHGGLGAVDSQSDATGGSAAGPDTGAEESAADSDVDAPVDGAENELEQPEPPSPETYFLEVDAVEPCDEIDDLCLTASFESAWNEEIDRIGADELDGEDAAGALGFDVDDHAFEIGDHGGDARTLRRDRQLIGNWPSQAALVADVTAARVLESRDDDWTSYEPAVKGELLNSLRLFLETCPTSGGAVVMGEETVESCCRSHDVIAVTCSETDERLFEYPVSELETE